MQRGLFPALPILPYERKPDLSIDMEDIQSRVTASGFDYTHLFLTSPSNNAEGFFLAKNGVSVICNSPEVEHQKRAANVHTVDINRELLRQLNLNPPNYNLSYIDPRPKLDWSMPPFYVLMHIGAQNSFWKHKAFPLKLYREIAQWLLAKRYMPAIIGDKDQTIYAKMFRSLGAQDFTGIPIQETVKLMDQSMCFIGNDGGASHLARACKLPSITLFGPTNPNRTASYPLGDPSHINLWGKPKCSPCQFTGEMQTCKKPVCHDEIRLSDIQEVFSQWKF